MSIRVFYPLTIIAMLFISLQADCQNLLPPKLSRPSAIDGNIQSLQFRSLSEDSMRARLRGYMLNTKSLEDSSLLLTNFYRDSIVSRGNYADLDSNITKGAFLKLGQSYLTKYNNVDSAGLAAKKYVDSFISTNRSGFNLKVLADSAQSVFARTVTSDSLRRLDTVNAEKKNWLEADRFAHDDASQVKSWLQIFSTGDTSATNHLKDLHSPDSKMKSISFILLALQDSTDIKNYFKSIRLWGGSDDDSSDIRIKMNDIKATVSQLTIKDSTHCTFFASGDFLNTIKSNPTSSNNNILSGSIGLIYRPSDKVSLTAKVILASTQDTVVDNYGSQLLAPAKGKGFGTGIAVFDWAFKKSNDKTRSWLLSATVAASSQHWRLDSSQLYNLDTINSKLDSTFIRAATILGIDITATNAVLIKDSIPIGNSKYALSFSYNVGVAARILGGDVMAPLKNKNSILYKNHAYIDRLPTTRSLFFGLEGGTSITIGPVTAEFELYYFPTSGKDLQPILGLTGLQVVFGATINLPLFHK